jgi:hypothetical protein
MRMLWSQSFFVAIWLWLCYISSSEAVTVTYQPKGKVQHFTVPDTVNFIEAVLCGGRAQYSTDYPYCIKTSFSVTPGDKYYVYVGGDGSETSSKGGFNGGGTGGETETSFGYGGGGASDIRLIEGNLSSRIAVAGGAGGGASYYVEGGIAGYKVGENGEGNGGASYGGFGGNQTEGGQGGFFSASFYKGSNGGFGFGGDAAVQSTGGGGGGGYYGGGGGANTGGGGGSSYCLYPYQGYRSSYYESGSIEITYGLEYTLGFPFTGLKETWYPPDDAKSIVVEAWGAQGGSGKQGKGGYGGYVRVNITTVPSSLSIFVGGRNGINGGGYTSCSKAGHGGGASTVSYYYYPYTRYYAVAAGGGGAGYDAKCTVCKHVDGGAGGGMQGGAKGGGSAGVVGSYGGYGGSSSEGGKGGYYNSSEPIGASGTKLTGGNSAAGPCGGGGGGGYYGGGGGSNTGGGGGSNYGNTSSKIMESDYYVNSQGNRSGDGYIQLTFWSIEYEPVKKNGGGDDDDSSGISGGGIAGIVISVCIVLGCCAYCGNKNN